MGKIAKTILYTFLIIIGCFLLSCIVGSLLQTGTIEFGPGMFGGWNFGIFGILVVLVVIYALSRIMDGKPLFGGGGDKEQKQYYDSKWLSESAMNKKYVYSTFANLGTVPDGIVLRAEKSGHNLKININKKPIHTMIIGTTGSGKTEGYVIPTIQILAKTKSKPGLVINDPKGELYNKNINHLKKMGYNVKVFDLRNAYASTRWNPMEIAYNAYERSINIHREVKVHLNVNPKDKGLKVISDVYNQEWYEFNGIAYPSRKTLENDLDAVRKQLNDEAYEELNDIATVLCPIESNTDPIWERGARDFVLGTMLAMLEDSAFPELGMTKEKFNFFNVYKICNYRDPDGDAPFTSLRKYFEGRDKLSVAASLAGPIVNNAPTTARSYFGIVSQRVSMFADGGMCFATSANEMEFDKFTDKPTALFVKIPDEKETRHTLASMIILQLYKQLVATANKTPKLELPRHVYFVVDEFGNLPKIAKLDSIITVGRSRRISLLLVVQSYTQINIKYGDAIADTLKSNCNIHVYFGTTDQKTKEEFSTRCGQTSVKTTSTSKSKGDGKGNPGSESTSTSTASRPLIYPDELGLMPDDSAIVSIFKESAIKAKCTFAWKCQDIYDMTPPPQEYVPSRHLDENAVYYDITERNRKVFRSRRPGSFDF
ncbi:MAG: type IV secretory system conjugative DNA transfer family protein [Firmicutes bacterium]|nr:type IV secretory system conjugative DNA transfer family protein [Bacillota bacterium]